MCGLFIRYSFPHFITGRFGACKVDVPIPMLPFSHAQDRRPLSHKKWLVAVVGNPGSNCSARWALFLDSMPCCDHVSCLAGPGGSFGCRLYASIQIPSPCLRTVVYFPKLVLKNNLSLLERFFFSGLKQMENPYVHMYRDRDKQVIVPGFGIHLPMPLPGPPLSCGHSWRRSKWSADFDAPTYVVAEIKSQRPKGVLDTAHVPSMATPRVKAARRVGTSGALGSFLVSFVPFVYGAYGEGGGAQSRKDVRQLGSQIWGLISDYPGNEPWPSRGSWV